MYVTSSFAYCYHSVNGISLGRPKVIPSNSFNCIIIATQLLKAALSLSHTHTHTHTPSHTHTQTHTHSLHKNERLDFLRLRSGAIDPEKT